VFAYSIFFDQDSILENLFLAEVKTMIFLFNIPRILLTLLLPTFLLPLTAWGAPVTFTEFHTTPAPAGTLLFKSPDLKTVSGLSRIASLHFFAGPNQGLGANGIFSGFDLDAIYLTNALGLTEIAMNLEPTLKIAIISTETEFFPGITRVPTDGTNTPPSPTGGPTFGSKADDGGPNPERRRVDATATLDTFAGTEGVGDVNADPSPTGWLSLGDQDCTNAGGVGGDGKCVNKMNQGGRLGLHFVPRGAPMGLEVANRFLVIGEVGGQGEGFVSLGDPFPAFALQSFAAATTMPLSINIEIEAFEDFTSIVPEPSTGLLFITGLLALGANRRKMVRKS